MNYPTKEEIEQADYVQLARWYRFLPSPGANYTGKDNFEIKLMEELDLLDGIIDKINRNGGLTPELSRVIGW